MSISPTFMWSFSGIASTGHVDETQECTFPRFHKGVRRKCSSD